MKIGIMTFHWATNYGAVLQSFALQNALERLDNDVEIIDYYPKRFSKTIMGAIKTMHPRACLNRLKELPKEKKIEKFRKEYLHRTKYFGSNEELIRYKFDYDCFLCGSDQIWNEFFLEQGENKKTYSYFLNFASDKKVIASYAASFGVIKYKEALKNDLKEYLDRFDFISVREKTGIDILEDIDINIGQVVPDPTLLLEKEDYEKLLVKAENNKKYAYYYMLHNHDKDADDIITYLKNDNLKILKCENQGIDKWLSGIYNSEAVITNSFHGVVFSILFERPFYAILIDGSGMNDRIITLLNALGLKDRIYSGDGNIPESEIDWNEVRKKLQEYRNTGYDYLNQVLSYKKELKPEIGEVELPTKLCSGCHGCFNICPTKAISMKADAEGFLRPEIDKSKCIKCGLCKKKCPILNEYSSNPKGDAYACINNDDAVRLKSSSGGVFSLLAENVLKKGGVVFGAAFDDELNLRHIMIDNVIDIEKLRGSKYIQSEIGDTYKLAKECLEDGKIVLFTGTPCQISGLKCYLGKDYDNLILQDIICHGVPSPKVFDKYLEYQKKVFNSDVSINPTPKFRVKNNSWKKYSISIHFKNDREYKPTLDKDLYMKAFLNNLSLRPSCYSCHSKSVLRESDITLADFWGVWDIVPEMFDDKGTSLVLVNSQKGSLIFEEISDKMKVKKVDFDEALKFNSAAFLSVKEPENRGEFMNNLLRMPFDKAISKSVDKNYILECKKRIKGLIKKIF